MSKVKFTVNTPMTSADLTDQLNPQATDPSNSIDRIARIMDAWATKAFDYTTVTEEIGVVGATGTVTFSSTGPTNTETMTIANVTITAVSGTPSGNQIKTNASATTVASELAALVNSSSSFTGIVTATSALGVVTLTAVTSGLIGNGIELSAGNFANTAVVGFSGGSDGTKTILPA